MGRKIRLEPHLSRAELEKQYKQSRDPVESRRFHLLWLVSQDYQLNEAVEVVGLNYNYGYKIIKRYNTQGIDGVKNRRKLRAPGKSRSLLNEQQQQELKEQLKNPPEDGGIWTGPKVARWIEKVTGQAKVWNQRGWDYLKKLNHSWQRPRPHHAKADPEAQEAFKKKLPQLKAKLEKDYPNAQVEVWAFDEHRVGLKPILRKVWSPIGERPIATVHHRYEWTYLYAFVCPATGQTEWFILPRVNTDWFNEALKEFAKAVGAGADKHILLTIDGAGWHRSSRLEIPEGIHIEFLPPYSPELQPAERLWSLADEPLVNRCFDTVEMIEDILCQRCLTLSNLMQEQIRDLTHFYWWPA